MRRGKRVRRPKAPTRQSWDAMWYRCTSPKHPAFHAYGGAGVMVCARWMSFEAFEADMGSRPAGKTLDRFPDSSGDYEPENCRWATPKEQARNKRTNRNLTVGNVMLPVAGWAERTGLRVSTIRERLARGWSPEDAVSEPLLDERVAARTMEIRGRASRGETRNAIASSLDVSRGTVDVALRGCRFPRRGVRPWAKLTDEQVSEMRARYAAGGVTHRSLAPEYGINYGAVGQILRGERWGWLR